MPLFKRKKQKYPAEEFSLPEPPEFDENEMAEDENLPELPDLPLLEKGDNSRIKKEFSRKPMTMPEIPEMTEEDEFMDEDFEQMPKMPSRLPKSRMRMPMQMPEIEAREFDVEREPRRRFMPIEKPIFIKLEKYKDSVESLGEIKTRLKRASSFLQKIKEIRQREDEELAGWQRDLEDLKSKLEKIDKNLFSDLE
ncbi:MAG: hypothetical protein KJ767_03010 [Nanoarchaeota archaeon]|nr:hypothetical protein [Nanoarchaeota archaeon]